MEEVQWDDALRRRAWDACAAEPEGLTMMRLARTMGVRTELAWHAVAWLLEGKHLEVRDGTLRAVGAA